jgi:hypothetical protein
MILERRIQMKNKNKKRMVLTVHGLSGRTYRAFKCSETPTDIHVFPQSRYKSAQALMKSYFFHNEEKDGKLMLYFSCEDEPVFRDILPELSRVLGIRLFVFDEATMRSTELTLEENFIEPCTENLLKSVDVQQARKAGVSDVLAMHYWYEFMETANTLPVRFKYLNTIKALMYAWRHPKNIDKRDDIVDVLIELYSKWSSAYGLPAIKGRHDSAYNNACSVVNNVYSPDSKASDKPYAGSDYRDENQFYTNTNKRDVPLTDGAKKELMGLCKGTTRTQHDIGDLFKNLGQLWFYLAVGDPIDPHYEICPECGYPVADSAECCPHCNTVNSKCTSLQVMANKDTITKLIKQFEAYYTKF